MTPPHEGAIGILQLHGDVDQALQTISQHDQWPTGCVRLTELDGIDECLLVRLDDTTAQIMPHGGPRVRQRLLALLEQRGMPMQPSDDDPWLAYPEASSLLEAKMLQTLARAASPLAIDLLIDQPNRWRSFNSWSEDDEQRSLRLRRLLSPPRVVITGKPNVGKSTLLNALAGRNRVITFDAPGTTRDFVSIELDCGGLVVHWFDTPGLHATDDEIEAEAIATSRRLIETADLLIALADGDAQWPSLDRTPDLRVGTKSDLALRDDADLCLSAQDGTGLIQFVEAVRDTLVPPEDLASTRPWRFHVNLPIEH